MCRSGDGRAVPACVLLYTRGVLRKVQVAEGTYQCIRCSLRFRNSSSSSGSGLEVRRARPPGGAPLSIADGWKFQSCICPSCLHITCRGNI
ncbi:hypothetical protein PAHAL_3G484900 [Panicum hallii]|uniref:Uncharacterized protein n=1 Tax=Panicum hallii TaxID=206008 RepID=A0A2T8KLV2_9POAL|nr:hypothetical protein PAHAL_3G484900 [Panicum hallii]